MSVRAVRWAVVIYMVLFLLATTWPGAALFNDVTPFVMGLPFNLFFIALLICGGLGVLVALYFSEQRTETN